MDASAHLKELRTKHASIEKKIKTELKSPNPDAIKVSTLKKQKLQLKDRMESLAG